MFEMGKNYEQRNIGDAFGALIAIAIALVLCLMITLCSGCKTKYIATDPVIVHERDSIVKVQQFHTHDTLIYRDSVYHYVKGDTILIEKWHTMQAINKVARVDTLVKVEQKEVPVPYPKPYPVEKELSWWQRLCLMMGKIGMVLAIAVGGWKIYRLFRG